MRKVRSNTIESRILRTSPVGIFPRNRSPYGVGEACGNVWEWTASLIGMDPHEPELRYPYHQRRIEREDLEGEGLRVLRGGSWDDAQRDARCACRRRHPPDDRNSSFGFRVAASPGSP